VPYVLFVWMKMKKRCNSFMQLCQGMDFIRIRQEYCSKSCRD